jgi:predicted RNase H-like nuclease
MTKEAGSETLAIGLDGARKGWAAAVLHGASIDRKRGWKTELRLLREIADVEELAGQGEDVPIAIDIPIGLPVSTEPRACDLEARTRLKSRRSSVFAPPGRDLLELATFEEVQVAVAKAKAKDPDTKGLTQQAWGLAKKIREVDEWMRKGKTPREDAFECHPEVTFQTLGGCTALAPKRTAAGALRRLEIVEGLFPDARNALREFEAGGADLTDALDAYAALATAVRFRRKESEQLGGTRDQRGLPMRMVI